MTIDIEHNGTHILNESDVRRLIDERDALAAACAELQKPDNWEAMCGAKGIWVGRLMNFRDPKAILAAHDAALVKPMVEALREIRSCYPNDYRVRITEIVDAALALYNKLPQAETERSA